MSRQTQTRIVNRLLALVFILVSIGGRAQLLDDSTKLVYGPTTSRYIYEDDLRHGDTAYHSIDTAIHNLERFEFKDTAGKAYQDLGNNGTALHPVYYSPPKNIGRQAGFEAYTPYVKQAADFKYYDTKSPFIELNVGLGGKGRDLARFAFSRNVNAQWNLGFNIQKTSSNKLVGSSSIRETQISGTSIDAYTFHRSKNSKYHLMFHAFRFGHKATETGGIKIPENPKRRDYFQYQNAEIHLRNAVSYDTRTRFHLYQEYALAGPFKLYGTAERNKVENRYEDFPLSATEGYYRQFLMRTDSTFDASWFDEWKIEAGAKGHAGKRLFYSAYAKRRDIGFRYRNLNAFPRRAENYLGGEIKLHVAGANVLDGKAEVTDGGQYSFTGSYANSFFEAAYTATKRLPSFLSERFLGNHYQWANSFADIVSHTLAGAVSYASPFIRLKPKAEISAIERYVYFNKDKMPAQNTAAVLVGNYSLQADLSPGPHFRLENKAVFNKVSGGGAGAIRSPDWNFFGKWYYQNILFNQYMEMQLGVNLRWRSAYFANAYDPITQQFHVQNDFEAPSYWTGDLFFVMKTKKISVWAKLKYLNQKKEHGYFETPLYPAARRMFDLGLRWHFYD